MIEYYSSRSIFEILYISILIYLCSIPISFLIIDTFMGPNPDIGKRISLNDPFKFPFKLIRSPHQIIIFKLTMKMSPVVFIAIYFVFIKFKLYLY